MATLTPHQKATLQAIFVTMLWSSSWVLIKFGLKDTPPLLFAGMRYFLAFLILLPLLGKTGVEQLKRLNGKEKFELFLLGIIMYFLTQGSQFISLKYFPAVLVTLILNFTPVAVALFSTVFLNERPTSKQILGIFLCLIGSSLYLIPRLGLTFKFNYLFLIPVMGMLSNATASFLGRSVNRRKVLSPLVITVTSMGIGSVLLLVTGLTFETLPMSFGFKQWAIVFWLATINGAFAFTLWNHTLRTLPALESNIINNTMMIQIAFLSWIFLGENLSLVDVGAVLVMAVGTFVVQWKGR